MEESDKVKFWLEKMKRIIEEVRCPPDQRVACAVSLLQKQSYDWWKCDAPKPGGPLTTRQPAEYKWRSGYPTPL